jgi:3-hydroxypropanoate dehydrogenase
MTATADALRLPVLDEEARAVLFTDARTANSFTDEAVSDEVLASIWELAKWPPTAANTQPLRVQFVRTEAGKARLVPLMAEGNQAKTATAPAVAILAADVDFHEFVPQVFPMRPEMKDNFEAIGADQRENMARFNAALQAGYFIMAVRAHGLAAGPMGGFDAAAVTEEFFPGGRHRAFLVINIGHPGENAWFPRLPRLTHADVVAWS